MKKSSIVIIIAAVAVVGAVGLVLSGSKNKSSHTMTMSGSTNPAPSTNTTPPVANQVIIKNFAFGPAKLSVKKGTKVTWLNQDDAHHDITPDQTSDNFKTGPLLATGESYSYTFETAGIYAYHCSPHPYMKAVIEVTE